MSSIIRSIKLSGCLVALGAIVAVLAQPQPDFCGRENLPCCPGFDDPGTECQVNCTFTVCAVPGFDAFCEVPVEGDPDIGDAPTICRGCGQPGLKCCDIDSSGPDMLDTPIGGCGSRSGPATCTMTDDGPMCIPDDPNPPVATVPIYGQCGGANYDGPTECAADLVCEEVNNFYSRCVADEGATGVGFWQQCGGEGYAGATNCLFGATCVEINQYYSQCRP